jgi:apolipoprotein N-acyltransferase
MDARVRPAGFPVQDRLSYLWLILGSAILLFANGTRIIPVAAWLGPVFLVRFLRTRKPLPGLLLGYLANVAVFYVQWSVAFKDAGAMFGLYTAVFGLLVYLPYVADRLLCPRIAGFAGTLILPAAWVTVEYALHLLLPLGTFFSTAYTQSSNLPLLQIMSVTGLWAVTFLVAWFASVTNYAWEGGFDIARIGRGVAAYASVLAAVLFFGGMRLAVAPPTGPTVQVMALTTNVGREVLPEAESEQFARLLAGTLTAEDRAEMTAALTEINADLFERTRLQAQKGARIVTWTEYNAHAFSDGEAQFLDEARRLARETGIYLAFPLAVIEPDVARRPQPNTVWVNKSVMITPAGEIAYQYVKANLLIGPESDYALRGPRQIQSIDTPYGRLASVICLDMEYPDFMRQAGRQGVDIMLSGAIDGTPSSNGNPLHGIMASYRTIESGFSLARGGSFGQNEIVDYQGRFLATSNHVTAADRTVVAHVPVTGTRTVYAALGDFFPWSCVLALVSLAAIAALRGPAAGSRQRPS